MTDYDPMLPKLRQELDRLSEMPRDEQPKLLAFLATRIPHQVTLEEEYDPNKRFTCFQDALDLVKLPEDVFRIASTYDEVYPAHPDFVALMIETQFRETTESEAKENEVVFYFHNGLPTHAGRMRKPYIVSKWGTGHSWRHPKFEVPIRYGWEVRFYRPISGEVLQLEFLKWAEKRLGKDTLKSLGIIP